MRGRNVQQRTAITSRDKQERVEPFCLSAAQWCCQNDCSGSLEMMISFCVFREPVSDAQHSSSPTFLCCPKPHRAKQWRRSFADNRSRKGPGFLPLWMSAGRRQLQDAFLLSLKKPTARGSHQMSFSQPQVLLVAV